MGRFQASNGAHYGVELSAEDVSSLITAGAGLVSAVSAVAPKGKKKSAPAKKTETAQPTTSSRSAAAAAGNRQPKKSNTALWIGGGVVALTLLGVTGWALTRGR